MGARDLDGWCILRTAGRSTLALATSLAEDGFDVWTPVETRIETVPRVNVKREIRLPIMRSYVFARAAHLVDLLQLAAMPVKPRRGPRLHQPAHPSFSVLHAFGRIPLVADRHLEALRKIEARRTPRKVAAYAFPRNGSVRVKGGPFGGMVGVVIRSTPAKTMICFPQGWDTEIPTSLLEPNAISDDQQPILGIAA